MNEPRIEPTTVSGVPLSQIQARLNERYPREAYKSIEHGPMKGRYSIQAAYVKDRMNEVFGIIGFGWRLLAHPVTGRVTRHTEVRTEGKGENKRDITYHVVCLENFNFAYRLIYPDGTAEWQEAASLSSSADMTDANDAYKGAFSAIVKAAAAALGGMEHLDDLGNTANERRQAPSQAPAAPERTAEMSDNLSDAAARNYLFKLLSQRKIKPADALKQLGVESVEGLSLKAVLAKLGIQE